MTGVVADAKSEKWYLKSCSVAGPYASKYRSAIFVKALNSVGSVHGNVRFRGWMMTDPPSDTSMREPWPVNVTHMKMEYDRARSWPSSSSLLLVIGAFDWRRVSISERAVVNSVRDLGPANWPRVTAVMRDLMILSEKRRVTRGQS